MLCPSRIRYSCPPIISRLITGILARCSEISINGRYVRVMQLSSDYARTRVWRRISLMGGIASVTLGLILLAWPAMTQLVVAALVGVWFLVLGGTRIAAAAT